MQGLLQLGFVFMQASTITMSMGVIQLLQAARRCALSRPPLCRSCVKSAMLCSFCCCFTANVTIVQPIRSNNLPVSS